MSGPTGMDLRIEWSGPDSQWVAVFVRDGEAWYLNGALVGFGDKPDGAVYDLLGQADHLVFHGDNYLTDGPISMEDRRWLFDLLDRGNDTDGVQTRYEAMRAAEALALAKARHPHSMTARLRLVEDEP